MGSALLQQGAAGAVLWVGLGSRQARGWAVEHDQSADVGHTGTVHAAWWMVGEGSGLQRVGVVL